MSVVSNRLKKQTNLANSVIQDIMNFQGDDWGEQVSYDDYEGGACVEVEAACMV